MAVAAESVHNPVKNFELWEAEFSQAGPSVVPEALAEKRILTEVDHILNNMRPDGSVPAPVRQDISTNLETGVYENAMPSAVSITTRKVEYREKEVGHRERVLMWLGQTAIESAEGYKGFYASQAAYARGKVEVREAHYAQEKIQAGRAQVFLSPKMSLKDAPAEVAKADNLFYDDSLRVSYPVMNSRGEVIAQRMESLLVRDVPLEAWVAMLKDPDSIFGKSFELTNEGSALSVMELFEQLELPEEAIPEGPVTLVGAVVPYIQDSRARTSVSQQLGRFRQDQDKYRTQAKETTRQWYGFELELAHSLKAKAATLNISSFIVSMQEQWNDDDLKIINAHAVGDAQYNMTRQLAAVLERGKRTVLTKIAATVTGNERALTHLDKAVASDIRQEAAFIGILRTSGASAQEIAARQSQLERRIAGLKIDVGGGCNPIRASFEGNDLEDLLSSDAELPEAANSEDNWSDKSKRKWTRGVCQVKVCPSPKPTEVGPCSVCKNCQAKFDAGQDPTKQTPKAEVKSFSQSTPTREHIGALALFKNLDKGTSPDSSKIEKNSAFALAG